MKSRYDSLQGNYPDESYQVPTASMSTFSCCLFFENYDGDATAMISTKKQRKQQRRYEVASFCGKGRRKWQLSNPSMAIKFEPINMISICLEKKQYSIVTKKAAQTKV